jgi:molybdopterin converting factor subunit 1
MRVDVRLFAAAREKAGAATITVELAAPATVGNLKRALGEQVPALGPLLPSLMIAVSSEYADESRAIGPGEEVAVIPPVSGGAQRV